MKTHLPVVGFLAAVLLALDAAAFGQGSLTPSGAPAPTMKTLDQIEARTVVNAANLPPIGNYAYYINGTTFPNGGAFYLTGNLVVTGGCLYISASNVTVDLNGYSIINTGSASGLYGIYLLGSNITILNGGIKGGGFAGGIASPSSAVNLLVKNVSVSGASASGIFLANGVAQGCVVNGVGGPGITVPVVSDCSATACTGTAIVAQTINNSLGTTTGTGAAVSGPRPQTDQRVAIPGGTGLGTYTINAPGSYYLTGNYRVATGTAIDIASAGVTLDLNGFTISTASTGLGGTDEGVNIQSQANAVVRNGRIVGNETYSSGGGFDTGGGFGAGVYCPGGSGNPQPVRLENLSVSGIDYGILIVATPAIISNCQANLHSSGGIDASQAMISHCNAQLCGAEGISGTTIENCVARTVRTIGFAISGSTVVSSYGVAGGGAGIAATSSVSNSYGESQGTTASDRGIDCAGGVVTACQGTAGSAVGYSIRARIANACVLGTGVTTGITHNVNSF